MNQPSVQVLERTFSILSLFTRDRPEWTTTEIARTCRLPIATVHRILAALRQHGFVTRDEYTKRFRLGEAAIDLGERARLTFDLRQVAAPVLKRLSRGTDETALLTVLNDQRDRSVCLERVESSQPLRLSIEPGHELPLHAGASQKCLLAFMFEQEIEHILSQPLEPLCRATITDPNALRGNLEEIRRRRWAISFEENNIGAWGVAVPILDEKGGVVAAIGLAGPSARLSRREIADHVWRLKVAAGEISRMLGLPAPKVEIEDRRPRQRRIAEKERIAWR